MESINRYEYKLAGIKILCEIPFTLKIKKESESFIRVLSENDMPEADLTMRFCMVNAFPNIGEAYHQEGCQYYVETADEWRVYHLTSPKEAPYACTIWNRKDFRKVICQYLNGKENYLEYSRNIINHLGLETLLRANSGLLLHASFIRWEGKGILFTAPSGTGKSTQANLWEKYESAETINGDRAALRDVAGSWYAYGLPYAGTSGIYRNEKAPVHAIIVLRQAKENKIKRLTAAEAFPHLYSEFTVHRWDKEFVEEIWSITIALLSTVPIYLLECLPDQDAVKLTKEIIMK